MYVVRFVQDDALKTIETISKDKANQEFIERSFDPSITELESLVLTVDIEFNNSNKVYTYFVDVDLKGYSYAILPSGEKVQIIRTKLRTTEELKAMAKSRGFSYSDYKVLHGTAIK